MRQGLTRLTRTHRGPAGLAGAPCVRAEHSSWHQKHCCLTRCNVEHAAYLNAVGNRSGRQIMCHASVAYASSFLRYHDCALPLRKLATQTMQKPHSAWIFALAVLAALVACEGARYELPAPVRTVWDKEDRGVIAIATPRGACIGTDHGCCWYDTAPMCRPLPAWILACWKLLLVAADM